MSFHRDFREVLSLRTIQLWAATLDQGIPGGQVVEPVLQYRRVPALS
jgi:hypothetical protein